MSEISPTNGERLQFELAGSQGNYTVEAVVVESGSTQFILRTGNARTIAVPRKDVLRISQVASERPSSSQADLGRRLDKVLGQLSSANSSTVDKVDRLTEELKRMASLITGTFNLRLHATVTDTLDRLRHSLDEQSPMRRAELHKSFVQATKRFTRQHSIARQPLPQALDRTVTYLIDLEETLWAAFLKDHAGVPQILAHDRINVTRGLNQEFDLPIRVYLDRDVLDATDLELGLDKFRGLKVIGSLPKVPTLPAGGTTVLRARMRDVRKQGSRSDVPIEAHIRYRVAGENLESPRQALALRVNRMEQTEPLPNPFRSYAGGLPVESPKMFFGREALIEEFVGGLSDPRGGMCYALYGQQRTGKSSALEQVRAQLVDRGAIVATMSMGTIDRHSMTTDFVEEVLDQFRAQVDSKLPPELSAPLLVHWPDTAAIERRPMRSFQRAREAARSMLRSAGRPSTPFVIVIDEFTYLHEVLRRQGITPAENNQLRDFMRQFKGLLEARVFSALIVGQDTMPKFLDSYPNEFSVMSTRKLDYLTTEETQLLADVPVRTAQGQSRYTGYALATIASYTDGHPFFTQILCDRIITRVNEKRRSDITDGDVVDAVESLIHGRDAIEAHRFDCLVTADNTHALIRGMGEESESDEGAAAQFVLTRLALLGGSQNHPVPIADLDLSGAQKAALDDLILRGVLHVTETKASIRILLYSEFLRRRCG